MPRRFTGLWGHPDFLKLWSGQTISIFGSLVSRIALPFLLIITLNVTPFQLSLFRAAEVAPGLIVGLFAGVWIDRLRRRPIMLWSDVGRALLMGSIPLTLWLGHLSYLHVLVVSLAASVLTVSFDVAYESYLPSLVEPELVVEANSKLQATASVAEVTAFGIAGALFAALGGALTLLADSLSFVVSFVSLAFIRKPEPPPAPEHEREPIFHEAKQGLKVLARNPMLLTLVGTNGVNTLFGNMLGAVFVLYVTRVLHVSTGLQGVIYGLGGISSLIGALLADRVAQRLGLGRTLVVTAFLGTLGALCLPLVGPGAPLWVVLCFLVAQQFLGDGPDTIYHIHLTSLRQVVTPNRFLGRVTATWRVSAWTFQLVGTLLGGVLGEVVGLRATLFLAVAGKLISVLWLLFSPVRKVQAQPTPAE